MGINREQTMTASIVILLTLCLAFCEGTALKRFSRGAQGPEPSSEQPRFCRLSVPCGWSVHHPITMEIDYYMPNDCICREGLDCIITDSDISITAYVHMCRDKTKPPKLIF